MKPQYRHARNTQEALKPLSAELHSLIRIEPNKFLVYVRSGKSIILIGTNSVPPISVIVGSRNQFTLFYSTQLPSGERTSDQYVEVVHDKDDLMWFRESGEFLTPQQVAIKLVTLVAES